MPIRLIFALSFWLPVLCCAWAGTADETFTATYFANTDLSGEPAHTGIETKIHHRWQGGSPAAGVPADGFSARWDGFFSFAGGRWLFMLKADDGVRLRVDGKLLIDGWKRQAPTRYLAWCELESGRHRIEIEYFEDSGWALLEADWVRADDGMPGPIPDERFRVAYFDGVAAAGTPIYVGETATIDVDWEDQSPFDLNSDRFSARWDGRFQFARGVYRFDALADDGIRVWVDGVPLIDAWQDQESTLHTATLFLEEGVHLVSAAYYEQTGRARAKLDWRPAVPSHETSPLGTNISALAYYSTEWTLADAMKSAGGWYTRNETTWDTGEQAALDLDADGWVRSLPAADDNRRRFRQVAALMLNGTGGHYPAGTYLVSYKGQGTLQYGFDAVRDAERSHPGRDLVQVDHPSDAGILMVITATDPDGSGDYMRDIEVRLPGTWEQGGSPLFHPAFLAGLSPYKVIRFMDFLRTNTTDVVHWQDRPLLHHARWNSERGAPVEVALALANQTGSHAWINIPHQADDDYVFNLALLTRMTLDPNLKVYVEYGNEIWNTAFSAGDWVERHGVGTWPDDPASDYTKRINWYGKRSAEVIGIWKRVWDDQARRVVGVMGGFAANPWVGEQALTAPLWKDTPTPPAAVVDALAIAPYFGAYLGQPAFASALGQMLSADSALDSLFLELQQGGPLAAAGTRQVRAPRNGALAQAIEAMEAHAALARHYGLALIAYEGGQHLVGVGPVQDDAGIVDLFIGANRDERMYELYSRYLEAWRAAGGTLFCHFLSVGASSRYGSWGALEYQDQASSPKQAALMDFILTHPCWWDNCP